MQALRQALVSHAASRLGIGADVLAPHIQRSPAGEYSFSLKYLFPDGSLQAHMHEAKRVAASLNDCVGELHGIRSIDTQGPSVRFHLDEGVVMGKACSFYFHC